MPKKDPRTQIRTFKVSSWTLLGRKSQLEKTIEKWQDKGWTLTEDVKLDGKYLHRLTFEYRLSDAEYRRQQVAGFGCLALIALVVFAALTNRPTEPVIVTAATVTYWAQAAETKAVQARATAVQVAINDTATATLWTPTFTPTITDTPTITFTPTQTFTPSATLPVTPTSTITDTPEASNTPTPRPTVQKAAANAPVQTYYTINNANVRECPRTDCDIVLKLPAGSDVASVGKVEGDAVGGNKVWRIIMVGGHEAYIHSSLVSISAPAPKPTAVPVQKPLPQQGLVSTIPPAPAVSFSPNCSGNVYNCSDLTCSQIAVYAATCGGDPSRLDSDKDGQYCETQCGG